jgi:uncharacterized protein YbaP (TraB family)
MNLMLRLAGLCLVILLPEGCLPGGAVEAVNQDPGCVWVVESPTTKLYLCGTIHLLRAKDYPLPSTYQAAYADSQRLVFELPPGSGKGPGLGQKMAAAAAMDGGRTLYDVVDPATRVAFEEWAKKRGMNPNVLKTYKPWYAAVMVAALEYQAAGAESGRGVDEYFDAKGARDGKPGQGLETVDQQVNLFAQLSEPQQKELLEQTLAEASKISGQFEEMVTAWKTGNIESLNKMLFEEAEKHPHLLDIFLNHRNAAWIAPLETMLAGRDHVMVLVGTGHLGGEKGVVNLLTQKGYAVRQLGKE